jgi:uncharacterized protein
VSIHKLLICPISALRKKLFVKRIHKIIFVIMQISRTINAPRRSSFMGAVIILFTIALLSLAFLFPHLGIAFKLAGVGSLLGLAILSGDAYAAHAVLLGGLLLSGPVIPLFRNWPFAILGPLVIYGAVAVAVRPLRHTIGWIGRGIFDSKVTTLIIVTVLVSSLSLVAWVVWMKPDIQQHLAHMPDLPLWGYPFAGLGFALLNAAMEEFVFRGIFMEAIDRAVGPGYGSVWIQAVPFATLHYWGGFPNGICGCVMVFIYGVMLGAIRRISRGMLAPMAAHLAADMTIFSILVVRYLQL